MIPPTEEPAREWLQSISDRHACDWCKHPDKPIYHCGLCRHCYDIKTELRHLHREVEERKARGAVHPRFGLGDLEFHYIVAIDMAESAQCEGREYGPLSKGDHPLEVEHELSFISEKFLRKDLYRHSVALAEAFSPSQRRLLIYLLSRMTREFLRRRRRSGARLRKTMTGRTVEQALGERFPGTYRVEADPTVVRGGPRGKAR
jgi:hypothetical protein